LKRDIERAGGEIRLSSPVTHVRLEEGAVKGVESGGKFEAFDAVISTIPLPFARAVLKDLPEEILQRYAAVEYMGVACVIAKLTRQVTDKFWINIQDPDFDIPGLIEYTNLRPMQHHIVFAPYYLPTDHPKYQDPDHVFVTKMRKHLKLVNPRLTDDDILDVRVHRYRYAQPVCPTGFGSCLPHWKLPFKGLFVADTSFYYPEDRGISESIDLARQMARAVAEQ